MYATTVDCFTGRTDGITGIGRSTTTTLMNLSAPRPVRSALPQPEDDGSWSLEHQPEAAGSARRIAREVLDHWDVPEDTEEAALLVVSELVTNAIEHAKAPVVLHLHRERTDRRVWVGVSDGGPASEEGSWTSSCSDDEHGRGLTLVKALAQSHGSRRHDSGTTYWARMSAA